MNGVDPGRGLGFLRHVFALQFPWTPSGDVAGRVAAVGEGVTAFKAGDEVFGYTRAASTYAKFVSVDATSLAHPEHIRTDNGIPLLRPVYAASTRRYPATIPELAYGSQFDVRRVRNVGHIKLQGGYVFISEMLRHESIGLLQIEENRYGVCFGRLLLGEVDTDWITLTRVR